MSNGIIDSLFVDLNTRLRNFKKEFAMEFVHRVEERTPVQTGALKGGWVTEQTQTGFELSNTQDYAGYVENGTDKMAPRAMIATTALEMKEIAEVAKQRAGIK
ncbi:HK97 gp10 family phage protein [Sapientia aquatica]|jgi:hypothetical protein|uniref:HK97 gp10 family phage protein n=1 Tax=Sapientia aquatica TaxID=1549640 RepID=A0A4R5VWC8_9BURK|nr:HK97 gp10 family phage protein [Sapientia aquatica]TDK63549.1 HK97 gp10 family phage protein [Sapientia aquatica]